MSIQLVTYANQTVTPTNDAIIYERAIDQNGIFYGCNVTVSSNEVHITGGYGMMCGREFTIQSEAIAVTLAPSGTLEGRLYVRLDLADADNPIQLLTATGNTLPSLEQDNDVNYTNGTYEMELATFTVGVSALSDCTETFETILGSRQIQNASGTSDYIIVGKVAICWGKELASGLNSVNPITFPITFASAPYGFASWNKSATGSAYNQLTAYDETTTGMKVYFYQSSGSAGYFNWLAIGIIS